MFNIVPLGDTYELDMDPIDGSGTISTDTVSLTFDAVFDGRGQASAEDDDFPFPTLRFLLKANHGLDGATEGESAVKVDRQYRFAGGVNPLCNIWCLSLPFLMERQPFIQGLTSAAKLGTAAAKGILQAVAPDQDGEPSFAEMSATVDATTPVFLSDGLVALTAKSV
jgi:hypothetical protein